MEPKNENWKWYVVNAHSGHEHRAKASLEERIRQNDLAEYFGEILIPTENVIELTKNGQKRTSKRKFFPGYMLVQMEITDHTWHCINNTPKITGFVGRTTNPPPIPDHEVGRLTKQIDEGTLKAKPKVNFSVGEDVRVTDGPFANFNGLVDDVNEDKGKLRVMVSIFGRSTPVELEFVQVEKA
ncbi:MAG: transcription termination/antitermination protein NusG [Myxococcota bacterium]|nr:transcription termination/antitermination protein NusG [Myxococcota bacterium]